MAWIRLDRFLRVCQFEAFWLCSSASIVRFILPLGLGTRKCVTNPATLRPIVNRESDGSGSWNEWFGPPEDQRPLWSSGGRGCAVRSPLPLRNPKAGTEEQGNRLAALQRQEGSLRAGAGSVPVRATFFGKWHARFASKTHVFPGVFG